MRFIDLTTDKDVLAAQVGSQIHELSDEYKNNGNVTFLRLDSVEGREIYKKSLIFLMTKAFYDLYPNKKLNVRFSFGQGVFVEVEGDNYVPPALLDCLCLHMQDLVAEDIRFNKVSVKTGEAIELCKKFGMPEKALLFNYRRTSSVNLYELDGYYNYLFSDLSINRNIAIKI